jgi:hypothetical protein
VSSIHRADFCRIARPAVLAAMLAATLAACGGGGSGSTADQQQGTNSAPTISGAPVGTATVNAAYSFAPSASDADGNTLTFSISGKPAWATFNGQTGALSGTPVASDVGTYPNIIITVADGVTSASLAAFSIAVNAAAGSGTGAATVSWLPPTSTVSGDTLTDLAGYRIRYGKAAGTLDQVVEITNPGVTSYTVENLASATWYFATVAYTASGMESDLSNVASKTIP